MFKITLLSHSIRFLQRRKCKLRELGSESQALRVEPRLPDPNPMLISLQDVVFPLIYITHHWKKHTGRNLIEQLKLS